MFNSLSHQIELDGAVVVDLFAGSGALGIEALSRGAARATFVERDRAALQRAAAEHRDARPGRSGRRSWPTDVLAWAPAARGIDVAFADPPYEFGGWERLLGVLDADPRRGRVRGRGRRRRTGWEQRRSRRYGRTWVTILERLA